MNEAVIWNRKAARNGFARAQNSLGVLLLNDGLAEGLTWLRKGADQGDKNALFNLGSEYFSGKKTAKDITKGVSLWQSAADKGHEYAHCQLGIVMRSGSEGVLVNKMQAFTHFRTAARLGDTEAMVALAEMFDSGDVGPPNPKQAFQWVSKAAANHNGHGDPMFHLARRYVLRDEIGTASCRDRVS